MKQYPGKIDAPFLASWIDAPGLPADAEWVQSDTLARVDAQRMRWEQGALATDELQTAHWTVQEWLHFLNRATRPQPVARLQQLDSRYRLTASSNAEIAHAWFRLALASGYPGLEPALQSYLLGIGRLKLIEPLYEDLLQTPQGTEFAQRAYAEARPGYNAIAQRRLDRLLAKKP
jgi:hypothetical protein